MKNIKFQKRIAVKRYKEGYKKIPESTKEIKALTKMSAKIFAEDAWSDRD